MKLKMIECPKCGDDMPELRLTQYGYNFCVDCSTVGAKKGVSVVRGTGDHTWNEIEIVEEKDYIAETDWRDELDDDEHVVELGIE
jgi:hypothetical protein